MQAARTPRSDRKRSDTAPTGQRQTGVRDKSRSSLRQLAPKPLTGTMTRWTRPCWAKARWAPKRWHRTETRHHTVNSTPGCSTTASIYHGVSLYACLSMPPEGEKPGPGQQSTADQLVRANRRISRRRLLAPDKWVSILVWRALVRRYNGHPSFAHFK
jgi:hypothetical protein